MGKKGRKKLTIEKLNKKRTKQCKKGRQRELAKRKLLKESGKLNTGRVNKE